MDTSVSPVREELALMAEEAAERLRALARKATNPEICNRAYVVAQMMLGRAVALRGTDPVQIPGPDGYPPITSFPDGRFEWSSR